MAKIILFCVLSLLACAAGQRITTIHLDGVQYFISRMNPYSPELNYFLAYQYCRSLGLQLASFETKEKAESMTTYLKNAGYGNYDFWTSGNRLGTGMFLWMSTGLPFNATFDFFENSADAIQAGLLDPVDHNSNTSPQRTARDSSSGAEKGCVILKQPTLKWMPEDCSAVKDFICEQTRCYYYNYGSIPVSSAQGRPITSTTPRTPVSLLHMHAQVSTTPLPLLMSTSGVLFGKSKSSIVDSAEFSHQQQQQPSFVSFKLNHDRSLGNTESGDVNADPELDAADNLDEDLEGDVDEEHDGGDSFNEHARELSDDVKDHVFPLNDNELIEELQQQLQSKVPDEVAISGDDQDENHNIDDEHNDHDHDHDQDQEQQQQQHEQQQHDDHDDHENSAVGNSDDSAEHELSAKLDDDLVSSTSSSSSSPPAIEVRLKQIAQDFEKMTNSHEIQRIGGGNSGSGDALTPQSSLSLSDLMRTLRPNEKQIIPQIDSDYSNAMRVLGKTSAVVNNEESRKFKVFPDAQTLIV